MEDRVRPIEVIDLEFPRILRATEALLGDGAIDRRLARAEAEVNQEKGFYLEHWTRPMNALWTGWAEVRRWASGPPTSGHSLSPDARATVEAVMKISTLLPTMPPSRRADFSRRILSDHNLGPLLTEIHAAAHYWQLGCALEWADTAVPNAPRSPDFTATNGTASIEIECKGKLPDAGRQIRRQAFYRLADHLKELAYRHAFTGEILISIPGKLAARDGWRVELGNKLLEAYGQGAGAFQMGDGARVEIALRPRGCILMPAAAWRRKVEALKVASSHLAVYPDVPDQPVANPIAVRVVSQEADRVLDDIFEDLRDATSQFSGRHTAAIVCYLAEIDDLTPLAGDSGLNRVTQSYFEKHGRKFVREVQYYGELRWTKTSSGVATEVPVLTFQNPQYRSVA